MKDWNIEMTFEPEELQASILKRPSIQNQSGAPKILEDTQVLSKIIHEPVDFAKWAIFCLRKDVENAKYIQDKFYNLSENQNLGVFVDYGRIMTLDDRSNVNDFKEAIDQFYSDYI
jgi:hypothetical protein